MFCEFMHNCEIIFKSIIDPDDIFKLSFRLAEDTVDAVL